MLVILLLIVVAALAYALDKHVTLAAIKTEVSKLETDAASERDILFALIKRDVVTRIKNLL